MTDVTIEGYVKSIQGIIEYITLYNMEFWAQLKEDTPDLMKLSEVGTILNTSFAELEQSWLKLVRMNLDIPPFIMRIYAKFLISVMNDRESASEIIRKLSIVTQQNQQKGRTCNNPNEFSDEQTGLISISGEDVILKGL